MTKKLTAIIATTVFVGLGLGLTLSNAFAGTMTKAPMEQKSCCGHCSK